MRLVSFLRFALCASALALPFSAYAAESTIVASLKGQARRKQDGQVKLLAVGSTLEAGGFVEVASGSSLGLTLPGGAVVNFGPGSIFRLKPTASGAPEITLLSGSVGGNFGSSAPVIRTPAGVVTPESASVLVSFKPGRAGAIGKLSVASVNGTVAVIPANSSTGVGIVSGQQLNLGGTLAEPARVKLTPAEIESIKKAVAGLTDTTATQAGLGSSNSATVKLPDLSVVNRSRIPAVSPNGEGSVN